MESKRLKQITKQLSKSFSSWEIEKAKKFSVDETQTRDFLIEPFFALLNYNKIDDYLHEYIADVGKKRGKKVDMAISLGKSQPVILIECKKSDTALNQSHFRQLNEYCLYTESAKIGILTNGIEYQFFSRSSENNVILNETPFFRFDITKFDDSDLEKLAYFYRPTIDIDSIIKEAEEFYFLERFDEALVETLYNPDEDFLKIVYKKMGGKRLTSQITSQLYSLINSASLSTAVDRIVEREIADSKSGILTTAEELKAYNIIKTILALSSKIKTADLDRIQYRDMKTSFSILVDGNLKKKVCSLRLDRKDKQIEIGTETFELPELSTTALTKYKKELVESALACLTE